MIYHVKKLFYQWGLYSFKVPPVCHGNWDTDSWIRYIDSCDGWPLFRIEDSNGLLD